MLEQNTRSSEAIHSALAGEGHHSYVSFPQMHVVQPMHELHTQEWVCCRLAANMLLSDGVFASMEIGCLSLDTQP